jgi:tetratricopeptide (TPR) repeat protein
MRCAYFLKKYQPALTSAQNLLNIAQVDAELRQEALLVAGNSAMEVGEVATAKTCYRQLANAGSNDLCAEAAYHIADIALNNDHDLSACETQIKAILASNYSSEYWYARTFILYGDLYKEKGNYFQARHTYQSIVDNYEGDDLVQMARERIPVINTLESQSSDNE